MDQTSKLTYYGFTSYQMPVRRKKKEEKLIGFVVSFKPQILSTWDQKNPPLLNHYEQFEMPTASNISTSWKDKLQGIEKQSISLTFHYTPTNNWGQNLYHSFAYRPNLQKWYLHETIMPHIVGYNILQWHYEKLVRLGITKFNWQIYDWNHKNKKKLDPLSEFQNMKQKFKNDQKMYLVFTSAEFFGAQSRFDASFLPCLPTQVNFLNHVIHFWMINWMTFIEANTRRKTCIFD